MSALFYTTVALGIAIPAPRRALNEAGKDTSTPFPCMNSPCGCRTAEHCWHNCCCHTLAERIEWARENQVRPPDDVLAEAKAEGIAWDTVPEDICRGDSDTDCRCCHDQRTNAAGRSPPPHGVVLLKALECQGFGAEWMTSVVSLPPPPVTGSYMEPSPPTQVAIIADFGTSFSAEPPTPPPRVAT